ncbi:PadR family transcriptional regulator [Pseudoflavonifractor sp. 524-17]|uniref:PadR family transcriptional regulator n=1 Tax=Pseudoflavonifractor sp. 524-17 TaxID=2304577 RepID=UPI0013797EDB|nr:PadR family transcriptional regulator [Pseudoflavonifractor sp. 524-17]NCE64031.1 PadR family transcriptional regulator [Pseudoflavonifractor sp. 524-17]
MSTEEPKTRGKKKTSTSPEGLEENLKKGSSELLILFLLREQEMYINEMAERLSQRSGGRLNISFPYAIIYRLLDAHYIELGAKTAAPDGRRRQYYRVTEAGCAYLEELLAVLDRFMGGVYQIINGSDNEKEEEKDGSNDCAES